MCGKKGSVVVVKREGNCYPDFMKKVLKIYSLAFIFLFPLSFLPTTVDVFGFGKNWILGVGAMLGLLIWVGAMLLEKRSSIKTSRLFWMVTLLVIWSAIGWFQLPAGVRMRSVMEPMGLGTLVALWAWVFIWLQVKSEKQVERQVLVLTAAGVVLALTSMIVFLIPNVKLPINIPSENPVLSIRQGWSLAGSLFAEIAILFLLVFEWIRRLVTKLKKKESYIPEAIMSVVFGLVLMLDVYKIISTGWVILDGGSAWVIAVETLKMHPFFGVGIGNFVRAFTLFRPASYNAGPYWSMVFADSSMGVFHLWTELGVGGLLAVLLMVSGWLRKRKLGADFWLVGLLLLSVLLLPINMVGLFLLVWAATFKLSESKEVKLQLNVGENNLNIMPVLASLLVLVMVGVAGFWSMRIVSGEYFFRQSLVAAAGNDGGGTYDLQIKAIGRNPYAGEYRRTYSQTNLALAQSLLGVEELSEEDKEKASVLVQQSVREAQAAISLDNLNSNYWANLAVIYRSLVGVVDGAADWSYQAYQQAAALDPVNPLLKLDLGGLLYAANRFEDADRVFEQVVTNKGDFANGWYNWAYTAKMMNKIREAYQRLAQAVSLVPADSTDFEKANEELAVWKKEMDEAIKQQEELEAQQVAEEGESETLRTADPLPTMGQEERVNVPVEELEPPLPTIVPTAIPTEVQEGVVNELN